MATQANPILTKVKAAASATPAPRALKYVDPTVRQNAFVQEKDEFGNVTGTRAGTEADRDSEGLVNGQKELTSEVFDAKAMGLSGDPSNYVIRRGQGKDGKVDPKSIEILKYDGAPKGGQDFVRVRTELQEDGTLKPVSRENVRNQTGHASIGKDIAPLVAIMASMVPGVGLAIGSALGATGTAASIIGGSIIGGTSAGLAGGNIVKGAATGGIGGAASGIASGFTETLGATGAKMAAGAIAGGAKALVNGGDFVSSAIGGAIPQFNTGSGIADMILNNAVKPALKKQIQPVLGGH